MSALVSKASLKRALKKAGSIPALDDRDCVGGNSYLSLGYQKMYEVVASTCFDKDGSFHLVMGKYPYRFSEDRLWPLNVRPDSMGEYLLYGDGANENSFSAYLESDSLMVCRYGYLLFGDDGAGWVTAPLSEWIRVCNLLTDAGKDGFLLPEAAVSGLLDQVEAAWFCGNASYDTRFFLVAFCSPKIGEFLTGEKAFKHRRQISSAIKGIAPVWSRFGCDFETPLTPTGTARGFGYSECVEDGVFYSASLLGYSDGMDPTGLCSIRPDFAIRRRLLKELLEGPA